MTQISLYISRIFAEDDFTFHEDIFELYNFVQNIDLRKILASFHTNLNKWFMVINSNLMQHPDETGSIVYNGGYFHAQDSRDLLSLLDKIDTLKSKCRDTEFAFTLNNESYNKIISQCRRFVVKSGGSHIPEDFTPIEIEELHPIFQMNKNICISQDNKTITASLNLIGGGSYANVYSYFDPYYKIKFVQKRARRDLNQKEIIRFKQEFEVLKKLHSPYVVEVYAYDEQNNLYTMERMDENIYEYISRTNNTILFSRRKNLINQICRGLIYIHEKNYLHRDISLTNVFIKHYDDVDVAKIGDFGLVKIPESNLTSFQSELKGSLNDPDLINVGFDKYEMCHEIFALTRLCYFILTGRTNIARQREGKIKQFWDIGTNSDRNKRFKTVFELQKYINDIDEEIL